MAGTFVLKNSARGGSRAATEIYFGRSPEACENLDHPPSFGGYRIGPGFAGISRSSAIAMIPLLQAQKLGIPLIRASRHPAPVPNLASGGDPRVLDRRGF